MQKSPSSVYFPYIHLHQLHISCDTPVYGSQAEHNLNNLDKVMSVSSPSSLNATFTNTFHFYLKCLNSLTSNAIYSTFTFASVFFLFPLYILILYMGFQQQRLSGPARTFTHSDILTYHMVLLEISGVFGSVFYTFGSYVNSDILLHLGIYAFSIIFPGQSLFHCLTCVERYLAAIHPITYMRLRETRGVRIRNISIACVWLVCLTWIGLIKLYSPEFPMVPFFFLTSITIIVILFCCISVLHFLTHPGPGDAGGNRRKAFHMLVAILGVLLLRFIGFLIFYSLERFLLVNEDVLCWVNDTVIFLSFPSSLVLPLLFLHRAGKLTCCKNNTESAK
ncbi:hypothetical protein PAMP_016059 [Pampus punctatissimus]